MTGHHPSRWALRAYAGSTLLLVTAGGAALAAAIPVLLPRLALPFMADADPGVVWSGLAATPAALQRHALAALNATVRGLAVVALAVAGVTILALSAVRAAARRRELGVRRAVGASRRRLLAHGLAEGALVAAGALVMGLPAGIAVARWATAAWPGSVRATWGLPAIATLAIAALMIFGILVPLMSAGRRSRIAHPGARPHGLTVPAVQLGICFALLVTAGQFARYAAAVARGPTVGQSGDGRIFELAAVAPAAERASRYDILLSRLRTRHARALVSLSSRGGLEGLGTVDVITTECGRCFQGGIATPLRPVGAAVSEVTSDTFQAIGVRVLRGRGIAAGDAWGAPRVAVVSRALAARHFEGGDAVGRRVQVGRGPQDGWYTVVGIADVPPPIGFGGAGQPSFAVYLSALQAPPRAADLLVRGIGDPEVERAARASLGATGTVVVGPSEAERRATQVAPYRWFGALVWFEGAVALAIALLGVLAVMHLWVRAASAELAVRRAVGARRRAVFGHVLARAGAVAVAGIAIGLWLGELTADVPRTLVAGLPGRDADLLLAAAVGLGIAALIGAVVPAWRAARTDPAGLVALLDG